MTTTNSSARERPILFSAPMVRAILDGTKTQTRRLVKPRYPCEIEERDDGSLWPWYPDYVTGGDWDGWVPCPYGQAGERLWVRETWGPCDGGACYRAEESAASIAKPDDGRWHPSIHMPRWACRIVLEVTGVRVERLQAISEDDARAEGITDGGCVCCGEHEPCGCATPTPSARDGFGALWESINGAGSWQLDPWVWVVEFKRLDTSARRGEG